MATAKDQLRAPSSESLEAGYETSHVSIKGLALFVVGLAVTAAIIHAGMWFLLGAYLNNLSLGDRPHSTLQVASGYKPAPPPPPRLQPSKPDDRVPEADLQLMYREEDEVFRQMGWTIEPHSHRELKIPTSVLESVIRRESSQQGTGNDHGGEPR